MKLKSLRIKKEKQMFATETENLVEQLIQAEYKNACENYGEKYHSKKEACDVLDEEVKEVGYELDGLQYLNLEYIKCAYYDNFQLPDNWIEETEKYVKNAIKELAQVGAVVRKIRTTKDEEEE
jgi:hypothetical protein